MSIHEYVEHALRGGEKPPRGMPREQALVYSVERVVESVLPTQVISRRDSVKWLDAVCDLEDWDTPSVCSIRTRRWAGVASRDKHAIGIARAETTVLVLAHELAHLVCENDGHGIEWRSAFVNIVRKHISVHHASLLHALYNRVQLPTTQWETSQHTL